MFLRRTAHHEAARRNGHHFRTIRTLPELPVYALLGARRTQRNEDANNQREEGKDLRAHFHAGCPIAGICARLSLPRRIGLSRTPRDGYRRRDRRTCRARARCAPAAGHSTFENSVEAAIS